MLDEHSAPRYWMKRAATLGCAAVGFGDQKLAAQDLHYKDTENFLSAFIDTKLQTLDYGCGIGRYAHLFAPEFYVGADMTEDLLINARLRNPDKAFFNLGGPYIQYGTELLFVEQVMTTTVLQHCHDDLVVKILASINSACPSAKKLVLYENSENFQKPHVVGRKFLYMMDLVRTAGFSYKTSSAHSHIMKGEEHTLTLIELNAD